MRLDAAVLMRFVGFVALLQALGHGTLFLRAKPTHGPVEVAVVEGCHQMEEGVVVIAREGSLLSIVLPDDWGLPKLPLYAESQRKFFARALPLQATFEVDVNGRVTGMLVHPPRGQRAIPARRL